ncbi:MAG: endolytic transglycosylase MltG [Lachnospiraceae bacterium]|nr:endolytic transglycosylase MltG [Lachnospiraceae bacterium]
MAQESTKKTKTGKTTSAKKSSAKKPDAVKKPAVTKKTVAKKPGKVQKFVMRTPLKIAIYAVAAIILIFIAYQSFQFGKKVFSEEGIDPKPGYEQTITIEPGMNALEIGALLEDQAMIESRLVFFVQSLIFELKIDGDTPGSYRVNSSDSGEAIIKMINAQEKVELN